MELRNKLLWLFGTISTVSGIFTFIDYAIGFGEWLSANFGAQKMLDIRLVFYIGIFAFPIYLLYSVIKNKFRKNTTLTVDLRFDYLIVWYSDSRDIPETENPHRPYFIVNGHTKQAYYVSDLIAPYVKKRKFSFYTRSSKRALLAHFKKQGITPNHNNPKQEELGLIINKDGSLTALPKIIYELKNRKLHDLEILWLFPWYYRLLPSRFRGKHPNKRLLRKFSTKEVFKPPHYDLELVKIGKLAKDNKIMKRGDHLKDWSERNGYTYINRRFNDEDFLAEE